MRFIANSAPHHIKKLWPTLIDPECINAVEPAGYEYIGCSSEPPYGPHVREHKERIWSNYNGPLSNVRVIDEKDDQELLLIEKQITELNRKRRGMLLNNFKKYRLAKISDFDPKLVRKAVSKKEAESHIPGKKESEEATKRVKL
jgi:hypothetical protein